MRAIQEELGVSEDVEDEVAGFTEQLEKLDLEEKTKEKVEKEISRFSKMQPSSAEATVSRNYIETILGLPWNTESEDNIDLNKAEEILNGGSLRAGQGKGESSRIPCGNAAFKGTQGSYPLSRRSSGSRQDFDRKEHRKIHRQRVRQDVARRSERRG